MTQVGIYIYAPAAEFADWLEEWTDNAQSQVYAVGQQAVVLGPGRRRIVLSQCLIVEIPAWLTGSDPTLDETTYPITFRILPVGLDSSVEVIGVSDIPELMPYLVAFVTAVTERWQHDAGSVWFGEPSSRPVKLCHLEVPTTAATLEQKLARFAADFTTPEISSVSFLPDAVRQRYDSPRRWVFRLSLHSNGAWQGIEHAVLTCEISRPSRKHPVAMTLRCHGFVYREIGAFTAAIVAFCRSTWRDTHVSHPAGNHGAPIATNSWQQQPQGVQDPWPRWTPADRPWEIVADIAWDRLLVELWWRDYTSAIIAQRLGVRPKTVINRLSQLRKVYGTGVIPTEAQRRGQGRDNLG